MKKWISNAVVALLLLGLISLQVFANSPPGGGGSGDLLSWIIYLVFAFCGLCLTLALELLTALLFGKCVKHTGVIAVTNVESQLLMHIAYVLVITLTQIDRTLLVVLLEVLVYLGEYLAYRKRMDEVPKMLVLIYTIVANTLSLAIGSALFGGLFY